MVRRVLKFTEKSKAAFHKEVDEIRWANRSQHAERLPPKGVKPFRPGCGEFCSIHPKRSLRNGEETQPVRGQGDGEGGEG